MKDNVKTVRPVARRYFVIQATAPHEVVFSAQIEMHSFEIDARGRQSGANAQQRLPLFAANRLPEAPVGPDFDRFSSLRLLADWESEIDSVNQWVTVLCGRDLPDFEGNKSDYRTVRDTYQVYCGWCVSVGRSPVGEKKFISRLEARGIDKSRMAKGYVLPLLRDQNRT